MVITIWLSILKCEEKGIKQELILALGDNTSAVAWLTKTSGLDKDRVSYAAAKFIARKLASLIWQSENFLDGQYMTGVDNTVADWLTFEGDERVEKITGRQFHPLAYDYPSNDALSDRFLSFFP